MGTLGSTLVCGVDSRALNVTDAEDAIWDILNGKAIQLVGTGRFCHSPSTQIEIPSVIKLLKWTPQPAGAYSRSIPLSTRAVLARDRYKCAYQRPKICQGKATTIDHVIPRAAGGPHSWLNVVAACRKCNHVKSNRSLSDLGWPLLIKPRRPTGLGARVLRYVTRPEWEPYLAF